MKAKNVWTGVKLSEQTPLAPSGVEQRLFAPTVPTEAAIASPPTHPAATAKPLSEPTIDPLPERAHPVAAASGVRNATAASPPEPAPPPRFELDLYALAYRKDTFLFTNDEFEALEDLKLEIGRALDVRVTKQNLVRCAVAHLIDDWRRRGANSPVVAPLKRQGGR